MSVFEGIEHVSAEGTSKRQYFEPGNYIIAVESVLLHEKRLGGGKLFIVETTIKESDNPQVKVGEQRNWVQSFTVPSALPRIKSFIGSAMGICPKTQGRVLNQKINNQDCMNAISPENPLSGAILTLECKAKKTQAGRDFNEVIWGVPNDGSR